MSEQCKTFFAGGATVLSNKTANAGFRSTSARKTLYRETAESEGMRLSEWLRWLADRRVAELAREGSER
jgi:hypothetical protein